MKLIVGLGNPGTKYKNTRHNAGFRFVDAYAHSKNIKFTKKKFDGKYATFNYKGTQVILLKPQKYMNLSGEVIKSFMDFYKINLEDLLVIYDDFDTEIKKFKLRYKGSSAGHNGLKNIETNLHTQNYKRLKIGIGKPNNDKVHYVIGKISSEELEQINQINNKAETIIDDYLNLSFDNLMNKYNVKDVIK